MSRDYLRPFAPIRAGHPLLEEKCAACKKQFEVGDRTGLVMIGPGENPEAQADARAGRAYNAVAVPAHWKCITGEDL